MPNTTADPIAEPQDNWQERYVGLQKVVAKRDEALTTASAELDRLRLEHEQATTELTGYRQQAVDASEEQTALATYEALRERFESEPPVPIGANPPRDWVDTQGNYAKRDRAPLNEGFPI